VLAVLVGSQVLMVLREMCPVVLDLLPGHILQGLGVEQRLRMTDKDHIGFVLGTQHSIPKYNDFRYSFTIQPSERPH
jgi:hypothetical protein